MSGITRWLCGGCGAVHGWDCPYYPGGSLYMAPSERAKAQAKIKVEYTIRAPTGTFDAPFVDANDFRRAAREATR